MNFLEVQQTQNEGVDVGIRLESDRECGVLLVFSCTNDTDLKYITFRTLGGVKSWSVLEMTCSSGVLFGKLLGVLDRLYATIQSLFSGIQDR